jgi:dihydropteroate synthase
MLQIRKPLRFACTQRAGHRMGLVTIPPRPCFDWQLRTRVLPLGRRTLLVGIVNITPDSFSDGNQFLSAEKAIEHSLRLLAEGADILDLGGESTRPGTRPPVSAQQEIDRVLPVIAAVLRERPDAAISIDTYKAQTARAAIHAGAEIVNDVSGFLWDESMAAACAELRCGVILMHTRGRMQDWHTQPPLAALDVVPLVTRELQQRTAAALAAGVRPESIAVDPGFGFGKTGNENYPLLAHLDALHALGFPILAGTSRKSFLGSSVQAVEGQPVPPDRRLVPTLASLVAAVLAGAHLVRVHDVREARQAVAIADAIRG